MLLASPSLLSSPMGAVANKWRTMCAIVSPQMIQQPTDGGEGRESESQQTSSPTWLRQPLPPFSLLRPELVAALLSRPYGALAKVKYLLEEPGAMLLPSSTLAIVTPSSPASRRAAVASDPVLLQALVMEVLSTPDKAFAERYPGYSGWLAH